MGNSYINLYKNSYNWIFFTRDSIHLDMNNNNKIYKKKNIEFINMKVYSGGPSCWTIKRCDLTSAITILFDGSYWRKLWIKSCARGGKKEVSFISTSQILLLVSLCRASPTGRVTTKNSYKRTPRIQVLTVASCLFEQLYDLIKKILFLY